MNTSFPVAIAAGEATSRSKSSVRPSTSRTNAWLKEARAANSSTIHSSAASRSVRFPSRPIAKLTAVRVVTANSRAAFKP